MHCSLEISLHIQTFVQVWKLTSVASQTCRYTVWSRWLQTCAGLRFFATFCAWLQTCFKATNWKRDHVCWMAYVPASNDSPVEARWQDGRKSGATVWHVNVPELLSLQPSDPAFYRTNARSTPLYSNTLQSKVPKVSVATERKEEENKLSGLAEGRRHLVLKLGAQIFFFFWAFLH